MAFVSDLLKTFLDLIGIQQGSNRYLPAFGNPGRIRFRVGGRAPVAEFRGDRSAILRRNG